MVKLTVRQHSRIVNDLVSAGNKPLPKPILTFGQLISTMRSWSEVGQSRYEGSVGLMCLQMTFSNLFSKIQILYFD